VRYCSAGAGSPARRIATRLRVSPGLRSAVGERDDAAGVAVAGPVCAPLDCGRQGVRRDQAPEQGPVGGDQGGLEGEHPAEVRDRPGDARDGQPAHDRHLVRQQDGGVQLDDTAASCTGSAVPGGVHAIQPNRPERQSVHHGGGRVADHRVRPEGRQGGTDLQQVADRGVVRLRAVQVGTRSDGAQYAAPAEHSDLSVREAVG